MRMNTDTQTNFSIHTFEMKRRLTHRDYEDYFNHLQKCLPEDIRHKDKAKKHKIIFSNTGKELKGVNRIELIRCTSYGYKVYYATFIINPRMLLNRDHPHLRIISPNQLNLIPGALDEIMRKAIPSWLPSLEAGFYDVETEGIPIDIITRNG